MCTLQDLTPIAVLSQRKCISAFGKNERPFTNARKVRCRKTAFTIDRQAVFVLNLESSSEKTHQHIGIRELWNYWKSVAGTMRITDTIDRSARHVEETPKVEKASGTAFVYKNKARPGTARV